MTPTDGDTLETRGNLSLLLLTRRCDKVKVGLLVVGKKETKFTRIILIILNVHEPPHLIFVTVGWAI